jgi:hypothetical protein
MKNIKYLLLVIVVPFMTFSCSKFLDRSPQDQITNVDYWSNVNDLKLYANQFYTAFPVHVGYSGGIFWLDNVSDNMLPANYNLRLAGQNNLSSNNANWSYTSIRGVNFGLENADRVTGSQALIDRYKGELYFFRAYYYFDLVKSYGDVPWIGKTINIDSEELYGPRTNRTDVTDSMLVDLDHAISFLPLKASAEPNRLNKECALLFKSRVALYEGSWQKYHAGTVFGTTGADWQKYMQAAEQSSKELIDLGTLSLYTNGNPDDYFRDLFGADDLTGNKEILLWKKYDLQLGVGNRVTSYTTVNAGGGTGLTKSLVDDFLAKDGKPIAVSPLYQGDNKLLDVVANRDPRLRQSIYVPGDIVTSQGNNTYTYFSKPDLELGGERKSISGYQLKKGRPQKLEQIGTSSQGSQETITAAIIFRYAETLLNYAEAKAELGTITQADIDISINKLRERAGMPALDIAAITPDPDWDFPQLLPVVNEIRRERRVELALEGFRFDDLVRWAAADEMIIGKRLLGAKFVQSDFPNLVIGQTILVNSDGYIDPYQKLLPNGFQFNPLRDYLLPVPQLQTTLNPNLAPNPGWQ